MSASPTVWRRYRVDPSRHFSTEELARLRSGSRFANSIRVGGEVLEVAMLLAVGLSGVLPWLYRTTGVGHWFAQILLAVAVISVPDAVYWTVTAELRHRRERHATAKRKSAIAALAGNYAESAVLNAATRLPLLAALHLPRPWVAAWLTFIVVGTAGRLVVPIVLLLRRTTPLNDSEANTAIQAVMRRAGLAGWRVAVVDQRRARHLGAWTQGFPLRRVLLSTSLAGRPAAQIEAAVAHELAHVRYRHWMLGVFSAVASTTIMVAAVRLATTEPLVDLFHASSYRDPAAVPLIAVALAVIGEPLGLVGGWLSRATERQADRAVIAWASDPLSLADLLKDLALDTGRQDQDADGYGYLLMSHPPAAERIELLSLWYRGAVGA